MSSSSRMGGGGGTPHATPPKVARAGFNEQLLVPAASYSVSGKYQEFKSSTMAFVGTYIRASQHERSTSKGTQKESNARLAVPKTVRGPILIRSKERRWQHTNTNSNTTSLSDPAPSNKSQLPLLKTSAARRRSMGPRRAAEKQKNKDEQAQSTSYWETPFFQHRKERNTIFGSVTPEVARERSIISTGRIFTWGGRMRMSLPRFDPHRERLLSGADF